MVVTLGRNHTFYTFGSEKVLFLANVNSRSLYAIARPSVCLSVCRLLSVVCCLSSVALVHPTQAVEIFSNISTAFGTLAIP